MTSPISIPIRTKVRRKSKTVKSLDVVNCEEHPLDQSFDSDYDSIFDESFETLSISSNSSFYSVNANNLKDVTSVRYQSLRNGPRDNVMSNLRNNVSKKLPESLDDIPSYYKNDDTNSNNNPVTITKKSKLFINLNQVNIEFSKFSINVETKLTSNLLMLQSAPKSIKLYTKDNTSNLLNSVAGNYLFSEIDFPAIELTSFRHSKCEQFEKLPTRSFRNRDERINCDFLRLYALDYHCRSNNYLPHSNNSSIPQSQQRFHDKYNLYKLSNDSKDKLWNSIVLKPRSDPFPSQHISHENYIHSAEEIQSSSLIMKNGHHLPWSKNCKSLKPTGIIPNKYLVNGLNPNSGVTNCQYTIKGWCNERWMECC